MIRVENLTKNFNTLCAVDRISFNVQKGEILGLLGPNGAGKTTAIRALSGLIGVDAGSIEVFGTPQRPGVMDLKRRIGLVTQEVTIFEDVSARENLQFFGGLYGLRGQERRDRSAEGHEFVGLAENADTRARKYSGGMKRRLNVACALTHRPELLIMDEPTVGIDPQTRRNILDSVKELNRQGMTVLYTTHYMEEAQELSDEIAIMDQGKIIAHGTHEELVKIVGEMDRVDLTLNAPPEQVIGAWQSTEGVRKVTAEAPAEGATTGGDGAVTLLVDDSNLVLPRLFESATQVGVRVTSVAIQEPNLEAVFLHLTGKALRD